MAKLIYSQQSYKDLIGANGALYNKWSTSDQQYYNSIVFTIDGYIITHGQAYKAINTTNTKDRPSLSNTNGSLSFSFGGASSNAVNVLIGATSGNFTTASVEKGVVTFNHNTPSSGKNSFFDSYKLKKVSYDDYGHIYAGTSLDTVNVDYITDALTSASKTYYLLGGEGNTGNTTYYQPKKSTGVYITTDSSNNATLTVPTLVISNGVKNLSFTIDNKQKTLEKYISEQIAVVSTAAMMFKGTIDAGKSTALTDLTDVANGDTYKVASKGTLSFTETSSGTATSHELRVGDVLIANKNGNTVYWSYIPAGDEVETFIQVLDESQENKYTDAKSGTIKLGNAALKAVATSVTQNDTGLVTSSSVYSYVKGLGYASGTVTGITPGAGLVNSQGNQNQITTTDTIKLNLKYEDKNANEGGSGSLYFTSLDKGGRLITNVPYTNIFTTSASANTAAPVSSGSVFLNLVSSSRVASSLELAADSGISLSATSSGKLTIKNTYTSNVTSAFSVASEKKKYNNVDYDSAKLTFTEGGTSSNWNIIGTGASGVSFDSDNKVIKINSTNTWRPVSAYKIDNSFNQVLQSTTTDGLQFGSEFAYANKNDGSDNISEIHLAWAEIDSSGNITYSV